ncbi:MAG: type I methionyl aminopeptidase [candidate division Zixibacteria bacterium]
MRRAGRVVSRTLDVVGENIRPGMTTGELDTLIESTIRDQGAIPGFKDYRGFPASACISINEEVVHGIPGPREIKDGDIVSVDVGSIVDGYYGDSARTYGVGEVSQDRTRLMDQTRKCLNAAIDKVQKGNKLGEVSATVQQLAESQGYGVVRQLVGHGIGQQMHEEPQVPNFGSPKDGPVMEAGLVIAIEPMINMGTEEVKTLSDGWTVITADNQPSAHFEHMVAVTDEGPDILTLS